MSESKKQPVSDFDPGQAVVRHAGERGKPAGSDSPTEEELAIDWTLTDEEINQTGRHRGSENLCRYALQICTLRKQGRFVSGFETIPAAVVAYICRQLDLSPLERIAAYARENTEADHQREIAAFLGWKPFDSEAESRIGEYVEEQLVCRMDETHPLAQQGSPPGLIEQVAHFLRQHRVILPGPSVLARLVNAAYKRVEASLFKDIFVQIPMAMRKQIDDLLEVEAEQSRSAFFRFAAYPPTAKAMHIADYLKRYNTLSRLEIHRISFAHIQPRFMQKLYEAAKGFSVWQIRRVPAEKRYALAACFLHESKKQLLDWLVAMHHQFMTDAIRKSRNEWEEAQRRQRKRIRASVNTLNDLVATALDDYLSGRGDLDRLFATYRPNEVKAALDDSRAFVQLTSIGLLEFYHRRYNNFRRYFSAFLDLDFACEPGNEPLMAAIELVRQLDHGEINRFPDQVDTSFIPNKWRRAFESEEDPRMRRRTWEWFLADAIKDALHSGDLYLPASRHHVSFWSLCMEEQQWRRDRVIAYDDLRLPREADTALRSLIADFETAAGQFERMLPKNPLVRVRDGRLIIKGDSSIGEPRQTKTLRQFIQANLRRIRIEHLIAEVDRLCSFLDPLCDAGKVGKRTSVREALMAALVAHGTNIGVSAMADSLIPDQREKGLTIDVLRRITRQHLGPEALREANTRLVNYHNGLLDGTWRGMIPLWGDGTRSSSDGQRFRVRKSSLIASLYPRYFGYYHRAVTLYTHVSDRLSNYHTEVISCGEREALYVLNGLIENESTLDIHTHHTDSHGVTDQVFALCHLLGFEFMPRFQNLKKQRLFRPAPRPGEDLFVLDRWPHLSILFSGTIDLDLIAEQYDSLVRIAASLKHRITSAHVIATRLANQSSRLARALQQLGRLLKTTYLLRYFADPDMRRVVEWQLNRGEQRQRLARHVFFANQGEFETGNYFEIMNKASCLSLLSNAILVYNTPRVAQLLTENSAYSDDARSHISPLFFKHVLVNGTYDFRTNRQS